MSECPQIKEQKCYSSAEGACVCVCVREREREGTATSLTI